MLFVELQIPNPVLVIENATHMKIQCIFLAFTFRAKPCTAIYILNKTIVQILFAVSLDYESGKSKPVSIQNVPNVGHTAGTVCVFLISTGTADKN